MASKRYLLGVFWFGLLGGSVAAQPAPTPAAGDGGLATMPPPSSLGTGAAGAPTPTPTTVLTAPPGYAAPPGVPGHPPGTVSSPWVGGSPAGNCCGPVGGNGPVTYEVYVRTGPNLLVGGGGTFAGTLQGGWVVAGGGRSMFFNQAGDAAWAIDLGLHYTYTRGNQDRVIDVFSPREQDANTGQLAGPDEIHPFRVRGLYRTAFSYALGRDWFLNGPGFLGAEQGPNTRLGLDVGGRWGSSHVDLVPVADPTNYLRRSGVTHGLFLGMNWNWERPMGAWVLTLGARAEWGVTMGNLVPPQDGNVQDVNLLMTFGVRF